MTDSFDGPRGSPRTLILALMLACLSAAVYSIFTVVVEVQKIRENAALSDAHKDCGVFHMYAERVGSDFVCVNDDGRQLVLPKKRG